MHLFWENGMGWLVQWYIKKKKSLRGLIMLSTQDSSRLLHLFFLIWLLHSALGCLLLHLLYRNLRLLIQVQLDGQSWVLTLWMFLPPPLVSMCCIKRTESSQTVFLRFACGCCHWLSVVCSWVGGGVSSAVVGWQGGAHAAVCDSVVISTV